MKSAFGERAQAGNVQDTDAGSASGEARVKLTKKQDGRSKAGKETPGNPLSRVLIVEDDPILGMSLEDAFKDAGTREVVICQTMQATKAELEKDVPTDAIVLDVHLADRDDGWAIAEMVRMLGVKSRIAFSTGSPESIPETIAEMGPIFEKPYDPALLVAELQSGKKRGFFSRLLG